MALQHFNNPDELSAHLLAVTGACGDDCVGTINNGLNLSNNIQMVGTHPCLPALRVTIDNSAAATNTCMDREIACASTDGRLLSVCLMTDGTTEITELDGTAIADGATPGACGGSSDDYENVTDCFQDITDPTITYKRIIWFDIADTGTIVATIWIDAAGAVIPAPANTEPCDSIKQQTVTRELYRLDGNTPGTSTAIDDLGVGTVGDTVTIAAGFGSLGFNVLRETEQDPGDGTVATTTIAGATYFMGGGSAYATSLPSFSAENGEVFSQPVTITVTGNSFIEIWVTRK